MIKTERLIIRLLSDEEMRNLISEEMDDVKVEDGTLHVTCPKQSWNMIRLGKNR